MGYRGLRDVGTVQLEANASLPLILGQAPVHLTSVALVKSEAPSGGGERERVALHSWTRFVHIRAGKFGSFLIELGRFLDTLFLIRPPGD